MRKVEKQKERSRGGCQQGRQKQKDRLPGDPLKDTAEGKPGRARIQADSVSPDHLMLRGVSAFRARPVRQGARPALSDPGSFTRSVRHCFAEVPVGEVHGPPVDGGCHQTSPADRMNRGSADRRSCPGGGRCGFGDSAGGRRSRSRKSRHPDASEYAGVHASVHAPHSCLLF